MACPVCGGGDFTRLFEQAGESFVRCVNCTLMLINPPPSLDDTAATYDAHYSDGYIRKADKKLKRCRGWVRRVQRRFAAGGRWLDVGCSAGFVVRAAADAGYDAHGVELEPAAVRYGREQLGLTTLSCGTLEAQNYPDASFDVISMYDVIEHVPDLNQLVAELHRLLRDRGIIEIRTPNVAHWRNPADLSTWKEVKPSEHLYYFDARTLERLFHKHGFVLAHKRFMVKPALDMFFRKRPAT